jgi:hypothetical protein
VKEQEAPMFIGNKDIQDILGCKSTKAGLIIGHLNKELEAKGYITYRGKVPRRYFMERYAVNV